MHPGEGAEARGRREQLQQSPLDYLVSNNKAPFLDRSMNRGLSIG
jgi:hypothetical protein